MLTRRADAWLEKEVPTLLANYTSHVLIWTSSSSTSEEISSDQRNYEMDEPPFQENLHPDLKRGLEHEVSRRQSGKGQQDLPLFEKYQFLSPGKTLIPSIQLCVKSR